MSAHARVICERGKFFIETGSTHTFRKFLKYSSGRLHHNIPIEILNRIVDLINEGNRDSAITLWTEACRIADMKPASRRRAILFLISYFAVAGMALYAFLKVL